MFLGQLSQHQKDEKLDQPLSACPSLFDKEVLLGWKGILVWYCMCDAKDVWCFSWYSNWISEVDESCLPNFVRYLCNRDVVCSGKTKHPVLQKWPLIPPSLNASNHFHSFDVVMYTVYFCTLNPQKKNIALLLRQKWPNWNHHKTKCLGQICQFSSETVGLRSFGGMSNTHRCGLRFVGLQATKGVD